MYEQIEDFKSQIKNAIRQYEDLFEKKNKHVPQHRSIDIIVMRVILDKPHSDLDECMGKVKLCLERMRTGWWIFKTGRSRLKNNIIPIIESYESSAARHLSSKLIENDQRFSEVIERLNKLQAQVQTQPIAIPQPDQSQLHRRRDDFDVRNTLDAATPVHQLDGLPEVLSTPASLLGHEYRRFG